jgi:ABC-2 type transport system ATP-binding protein
MSAIEIAGLSHWYGERRALDDVSLAVEPGEVFGLLGPNGGGKTTLFRVLSTLLPVQTGSVQVLGCDARRAPAAIRRRIGVTFQSPSLDGKLTVLENLRHQGHLYGLAGRALRGRIDGLLDRLALAGRAGDRVETLSGGLKRRVEIAKGLLHGPELLLLDEPSTGLDPGARLELWRHLGALRGDAGVTVVVTTHLMDEAERCGRLAVLDRGRLVALGAPDELRGSLGGDCLTIHSEDPAGLAREIAGRFGIDPQPLGDALRIEHPRGHELLGRLMEAFPDRITNVALGKPTLEDVFIARTGHRFWEATAESL